MFHQGLQIQDLQQERIRLHRDIYTMAQELGVSLEALRNYEIAEGVRLFSVDPNSEDYPGDTDILGMTSYFGSLREPNHDRGIYAYNYMRLLSLFFVKETKEDSRRENH